MEINSQGQDFNCKALWNIHTPSSEPPRNTPNIKKAAARGGFSKILAFLSTLAKPHLQKIPPKHLSEHKA